MCNFVCWTLSLAKLSFLWSVIHCHVTFEWHSERGSEKYLGFYSGDVSICPHVLHQYTIEDQGALGQYGDSCYEIVPIRTTWLKGKTH